MKHDTGKRSLEGLKVFPYVAWGLVFGFAFFVYDITLKLQDVTDRLQVQTTNLETQIATSEAGDPAEPTLAPVSD
jgi:hypothetical protein